MAIKDAGPEFTPREIVPAEFDAIALLLEVKIKAPGLLNVMPAFILIPPWVLVMSKEPVPVLGKLMGASI